MLFLIKAATRPDKSHSLEMLWENDSLPRRELEILLISRILTAGQDSVFIDDAIRIQKYYEELQGTSVIGFLNISTSGSVVVRINGNREGNGHSHMTLLYFAVSWQVSILLLSLLCVLQDLRHTRDGSPSLFSKTNLAA